MYIAVKAGEHKIVAEIIASDGSVQIPRQSPDTATRRHAALRSRYAGVGALRSTPLESPPPGASRCRIPMIYWARLRCAIEL